MVLSLGVGIIQALLVMVLMQKVRRLNARIDGAYRALQLLQSQLDERKSLTAFRAPIVMRGYEVRGYDS